ncbi:sortase [Candidatus Collierbacteria bacterium]|nr:sortase [Candidatus Collierbacteria bacterium]
MLYSYQKATPDHPSPGKLIPRYLRILPILVSALGLGLVTSVSWPIVSYQIDLFASNNEISSLLSPAVYDSLTQKANAPSEPLVVSEVDYTKASNWFAYDPFVQPSPKSDAPPSPPTTPDTIIPEYYQLSIPSLKIPKADVKVGGEDLSLSLIHYNETALPGTFGSPVIFGHSSLPQFFKADNYLTIFSTLPTISIGADIFVTFNDVQYTYRVTKKYEVKPSEVWVLRQDYSQKTLKLITCVPPGTKLRRLVVEAELIRT